MSESFIRSVFNRRGSLNSASYLSVVHHLTMHLGYVIKCLLFLPAAGNRNNSNGQLNNRGNNGYYWSSTENSSINGYNMNFNSAGANVNNDNRTNGFSVRCVAAFNRTILNPIRH